MSRGCGLRLGHEMDVFEFGFPVGRGGSGRDG